MAGEKATVVDSLEFFHPMTIPDHGEQTFC